MLDLPIDVAVLVQPGREELLLGRGNRSIRASIEKGSLLHGPVRLEFRLASSSSLMAQAISLRRFAAFRQRQSASIARAAEGSQIKRLALIKTLDAMASDARHRQVAIALFGCKQVEDGWDGATDHLRSRVRRLIHQARALAAWGPSAAFAAISR